MSAAPLHFLFPSDPLNPRKVDEHYAREAASADQLGVSYSVLDFDALLSGRFALSAMPERGRVLYRGWMLDSGTYATLARWLTQRGLAAVTGAEAYRAAHELPGWYEPLRDFTPRSAELEQPTLEATRSALARLHAPSAVVKDYVKSMKHYWDTACFIPDTADAAQALAVISRFIELRDSDLQGRVVLRAFEQFTSPEVRTWWVAGQLALITAHPDTPDELRIVADARDWLPSELTQAIGGLNLPFITADLARDAQDRWRVIEVGDGQVSDLPSSTPAAELHQAVLSFLA